MIELSLVQGSKEWHEARATHDCASEAASALGLSKHCTRSDLLRIKHTGITADVSEWTQRFLFDKGHEVEALARPIVEARIQQSLYPITVESDDHKFLASLDGIVILDDMITIGDLVWENKIFNQGLHDYLIANNDLPDTHWPQCEHQLLVTGAKQVYFTTSDGTEEKTTGIYYESKPERRELLIAGWKQFNEDLKNYKPPEITEIPKADVAIQLPALFVHAKGEITTNNMAEFGKALTQRLAETRAIVLITDQDFSNAKESAKNFRQTAKDIVRSKEMMLEQTETIGEAARKMDVWAADLNKTALQLEKDIEREDLAKKEKMVLAAKVDYAEYIASLESDISPIRIGMALPNFASAIKGKSKYASMQDAIDTMLSMAKIESASIAKDLRSKLDWCKEHAAGYSSLLPDLQTIINKPMEDFVLTISSRIDKSKADEAARLNAEREKIRAEEQAKAEANARREAQEAAMKAEVERLAAIVKPAEPVAAPVPDAKTLISAMEQNQQVTNVSIVNEGKTMKLGDICNRLGFNLTADFLTSLGYRPVAIDKNAKLYSESSFKGICSALVNHISNVSVGHKQAA